MFLLHYFNAISFYTPIQLDKLTTTTSHKPELFLLIVLLPLQDQNSGIALITNWLIAHLLIPLNVNLSYTS